MRRKDAVYLPLIPLIARKDSERCEAFATKLCEESLKTRGCCRARDDEQQSTSAKQFSGRIKQPSRTLRGGPQVRFPAGG